MKKVGGSSCASVHVYSPFCSVLVIYLPFTLHGSYLHHSDRFNFHRGNVIRKNCRPWPGGFMGTAMQIFLLLFNVYVFTSTFHRVLPYFCALL